ncbi:MAG: hypothetical protein LBG15_00690 [Dysgonamonadaceae bacterium]|jgi:hypothetical protein|nr:hypothetical protein [Dysgonamonadaceae bacterium]
MRDIKYKNISEAKSKILTTFNEKNKNWFTVSDADKCIPGLAGNALRIQLKRMTDEGLLMRVRYGVYYIIPYEQKNVKLHRIYCRVDKLLDFVFVFVADKTLGIAGTIKIKLPISSSIRHAFTRTAIPFKKITSHRILYK